VKLLNQGLQLQNTYHRWFLYDLLFSLFLSLWIFTPSSFSFYWLYALLVGCFDLSVQWGSALSLCKEV
jgi:hypothetical protein